MGYVTAIRRKATIMILWNRNRESYMSRRTSANPRQKAGCDGESRRCPKCRAEVYNLQFCPSCHELLFEENYSGC